MTPAVLANWLQAINEPHVILGYGSLMNADSRNRHSNIPHHGIAVSVLGFERAWVTRSLPEQQTYVGAYQCANARLNAQLVPSHLDPSIQQREQDYRFTPVSTDQLRLPYDDTVNETLVSWLSERQVWICETLQIHPADNDFPVYQSYVDTCLAGCLELGGEAIAREFIQLTACWEHPRINDRESPEYPRAASVSRAAQNIIDGLLHEYGY
ncbi:gamma-glutamylcyclotransferase [Alteromonas sp. AMM-1]|uniref:gamma-glutamylcyclotransferase n=1 Tax=Alteromonas sp. AMM-1 TaxID=3394233 RepID=UPI0039A53FFD